MKPIEFFKACITNGIPRRSFKVALVVGPILTLINQGDVLLAGEGLSWIKAILTFLVPYCVASVGAVTAGVAYERTNGRTHQSSALEKQNHGACHGPSSPVSSAHIEVEEFGASPLKARVHVTLKSGVLDPQGKAIEHALSGLGFSGVENVRQGKVIEFTLEESDAEQARQSVEAMCRKLLANTVIENYAIELEG